MNKIKELRIENNLTQAELGQLIGVNQSAVGKYEREELEPNIDALVKISQIFGCTVDYLIGREDDFGNVISSPSNNLTENERKLLSAFSSLGPFEQETILIQISALAKTKNKA